MSDGEVKYIGKTVTPLATRMRGYLNPSPSQTTNVRGNAAIKDLLRVGAAVELFVLPDNGLLRYGGFHINLAAGLEDDLIRVISPEWNGGRREAVLEEGPGDVQQGASLETPRVALEETEPLEVRGRFVVTLHATYYRQGFFNVGVDYQALLGSDGEQIEIYLGASEDPVVGSINRRANTNHTPRIMGGRDLREWFQTEGREKDRLSVTVLSPTSIRLMVMRSGGDDG